MLTRLARLFAPASPAPLPPEASPWLGAHDPKATEADILACFRLILGRRPNPEEWPGHASRAGEDLGGVVASYTGSLEFSRRRLGTAGGTAALADLPDFRIYAAPDDAAVGRHVRENLYEPEVTSVFRQVLRPGMGVVDIGANIGWFSMLSASIVGPTGLVVSVEPNGSNARMLEASRRANGFGQMRVVQAAAGPAVGMLVLHRSYSNGTTSALPDDAAALFEAESVACLPVDLVVPEGRRIDLIKVDVEGAEFLALQGCAGVIGRDRPVIVSEFSPDLMPGISGVSGPVYLEWLLGQGYTLHVIGLDGTVGGAEQVPGVMAAYAARGADHIDIVARPA